MTVTAIESPQQDRTAGAATSSLVPARARPAADATAVPPLGPRLQLVRGCIVMIAVLAVSLLVHLALVSRLQHDASQQRAYAAFRSQLANGTAPVGPTDSEGRALPAGTPVALLSIPAIDLEEVVGEGTTAGALFDGPGHRRDTPLPGQFGVSLLFGRRAAYGGPFARLAELEVGDRITVTTGQGTFEFDVAGLRREGDPIPPPVPVGGARLTLLTADGPAFLPHDIVRVDADLAGAAVGGPPRAPTASLSGADLAMEGDAGSLWVLAMWQQALIVLALGAVWSWHRWGRAQTWVVFTPLLAVVGLAVSAEITRLLPNVM